MQGAAECFLEFVNAVREDVRADKFISDWLSGEFRRRVLG